MNAPFLWGWIVLQQLTLPAIWQKYQYVARTHELTSGPDGWYGQTEEGRVYRFTSSLMPETIGTAQPFQRWLPLSSGWVAWSSLKRVFRHSSSGSLVWVKLGESRLLPGDWYEALPTPDEEALIVADQQNLYLYTWRGARWDTLTRLQGQRRAGTTDWLYEEEFGFTRAFAVSPSGHYLAYLLLDNTYTPLYPLLKPTKSSYPSPFFLPYPRPAERNPTVELHLYDLIRRYDTLLWIDSTGGYIPWLSWSPMGDELYFTHLNRRQNQFTLYQYEVGRSTPLPFFSDSTRGFFTWDNRRLIVWATDRPELFYLAGGKGEWEIWHYDYKGRRLGVYAIAGLRELIGYAEGKLFFTASGATPADQRVGYLALSRRAPQPIWLTPPTGWAEAELAGALLWIKESSFSDPYRERLCHARDPRLCESLPDLNVALRQDIPPVRFHLFQFPGANSLPRWAYLLLPEKLDSSRQYPVVLTFYGGPGSQQVSREFKNITFFWQAYLVQKGYIVACVDGRGSALYPNERFSVYRQLGLLETEDLAAFVRYLRTLPFVGKIGAFGWSYGGYLAIRLAFAAPPGLSAVVAVAPVTDWRLYDTAYTERFMDLVENNRSGYELTRLPPTQTPLRLPLLVMHGEADDNVHPQHTFQFVENLLRLQPEAPIQWRIFPGQNHSLAGYRYRVFWEVEAFFSTYLR
ncbi:MAG: prolyl oligopeptidase family serine peptidase [Bacteroidia bacterium]|nr:prolyl oligopeptidase family serine peptidase [Bacteroidia bacterium]MDW8015290.1 prolyl oligopeptidase family serine peptidase [Bacteroidia bacterium]